MYDVIVIGGGPAGLAASIYFARQKFHFALFAGMLGGQTLLSSEIDNYLGFQLIDGASLVKKFREHLMEYAEEIELHEGENVDRVEKANAHFRVTTKKGSYEARTVFIATGEEHRKLNVPGEKEFYGKGVTYCATCDAPLFRGKEVAVVGGGNSAMESALLLTKYATRVHIINLNASLMGDAVVMKRVLSNSLITVHSETKTTKILGDAFVTGLEYEKKGMLDVLQVQGVFIEIGLIPVSGFIDIVRKDKWGQIEVDGRNQTSVEGIWAAGDVTNVTEKQIAVAVGEGSKASLEIIKWLQQHEEIPA